MFSIVLQKGYKKAPMEYQIDAHTEKEAFALLHKAIAVDFPECYLLSCFVSKLTNKKG